MNTRCWCKVFFPQNQEFNISKRAMKAPPGMPKKRKKNGKMMLSYPKDIASSKPNSSKG